MQGKEKESRCPRSKGRRSNTEKKLKYLKQQLSMKTMSSNKETIDGVLINKKKWNSYYPQNMIENENLK